MNAPFSTQVPRFNELNNDISVSEEFVNQYQKNGKKEPTRKMPTRSSPKGIMQAKYPRFE